MSQKLNEKSANLREHSLTLLKKFVQIGEDIALHCSLVYSKVLADKNPNAIALANDFPGKTARKNFVFGCADLINRKFLDTFSKPMINSKPLIKF